MGPTTLRDSPLLLTRSIVLGEITSPHFLLWSTIDTPTLSQSLLGVSFSLLLITNLYLLHVFLTTKGKKGGDLLYPHFLIRVYPRRPFRPKTSAVVTIPTTPERHQVGSREEWCDVMNGRRNNRPGQESWETVVPGMDISVTASVVTSVYVATPSAPSPTTTTKVTPDPRPSVSSKDTLPTLSGQAASIPPSVSVRGPISTPCFCRVGVGWFQFISENGPRIRVGFVSRRVPRSGGRVTMGWGLLTDHPSLFYSGTTGVSPLFYLLRPSPRLLSLRSVTDF